MARPDVASPALRGIGWDHRRCMGPLEAGAVLWRERTGVAVEWDRRSLLAFGDQPLEELAGAYDLLVVDHPFVGAVAGSRCLMPLEELLDEVTLGELAADAIGASHSSYEYGGSQWGLATDGACQVAAVRDDLLAEPPRTWDAVLDLARGGGRVALPLKPADAICAYVTLLANGGHAPPVSEAVFAEREAGLAALAVLRELAEHAGARCLDENPPALLDRMTETDEIAYTPLAFGYTNYSRPGERPRPVRFLDIPSSGLGPAGSVLGGAGLAVSASSRRQGEAAAFAAWLSGAEAQRTVVAAAGGQPGSRSAWLDPEVDRLTGGFTSGTIATIEAAYVRPTDPWWPPFQLAAGEALNAALRRGADPEEAYDLVEARYRAAVGAPA